MLVRLTRSLNQLDFDHASLTARGMEKKSTHMHVASAEPELCSCDANEARSFPLLTQVSSIGDDCFGSKSLQQSVCSLATLMPFGHCAQQREGGAYPATS